MTYENFLKFTLELQKQDRIITDLYKKNIDLIEFVDPYHVIITILVEEVYGTEGLDWFSWFCYEIIDRDWETNSIRSIFFL